MLYRVHGDILSKHSEVFRDVLDMKGEGGTSDEVPLHLETIKMKDFDCLMSWVYDAE